jgi:hypothetical protein
MVQGAMQRHEQCSAAAARCCCIQPCVLEDVMHQPRCAPVRPWLADQVHPPADIAERYTQGYKSFQEKKGTKNYQLKTTAMCVAATA